MSAWMNALSEMPKEHILEYTARLADDRDELEKMLQRALNVLGDHYSATTEVAQAMAHFQDEIAALLRKVRR